ncbi:AraC family transcriptional regulator [Flavobacterium sp. A45]|uniref:AraC family transcriptional regulator n=1 Tax=Flavobacterium sp. A45 TaxID=1945862 RepID=UPI0009862D9C|nr:AraC family transcriptional regulator [Flavobacterium sp. A45]OOG63182.1 AraC family transcriptional regulator [Flavobacterium sp. A45]
MKTFKQRDGFQGEKLISLPDNIWQKAIKENPVLSHLYITHIGYFPKAAYHFRKRKNGCTDNILFYCLRGKGWYTIKDKRFEVGPNQFFIIPATKEFLSYGADENDPWTIYWIHFSGNDMETFNKSFNIGHFDGPQQITFNEKGIELWEIMYQNLEMGYGKENITKANLCLYHFVSSFLYPDVNSNEKKQDEKDSINNTILFMRSKLAEKLTLEDLAQMNNLSPSHFSLLFKKSTGMSPLDYFIHLKLQQACLQLLTSEVKIKNIAADLGYDDPYYFSRLFKKYMNMSPLQYRFSPPSKSS